MMWGILTLLPPHTANMSLAEIKHGSFRPLVFSATGGMAPAATIAYKRLASLLADKHKQDYSKMISWLRCSVFSGKVSYHVFERSTFLLPPTCQTSIQWGSFGCGHQRGKIWTFYSLCGTPVFPSFCWFVSCFLHYIILPYLAYTGCTYCLVINFNYLHCIFQS